MSRRDWTAAVCGAVLIFSWSGTTSQAFVPQQLSGLNNRPTFFGSKSSSVSADKSFSIAAGPTAAPNRKSSPRHVSRMSLQTPPETKETKETVAKDVSAKEGADSGADGKMAEDAAKTPKKRTLGVKEPEDKDLMWKVDVNTEDVLAFADRTIDTAEDAFMHVGRMFKKPARMNLPLKPGERPLTATKKERVVILGTGWGGHAISKVIDVDKFEVIYISPRNYFIFTPMLAASSVGTVDVRSITEPIRMANPCVQYVDGEVVGIDPEQKKVVIALPSAQEKRPQGNKPCVPGVLDTKAVFGPSSINGDGQSVVKSSTSTSTTHEGHSGKQAMEPIDPDQAKPLMELSFDKLVYAVGTKTGTFGVPGVQDYCYMLKEAQDARVLRAAIVNVFEEACLPGVTDEQKRNLLAFVVIGAGPTGVEFTGELTDLIGSDVPRLFPELIGFISVTVVSAGQNVLPTFEKVLQDRGLKLLRDQGIEILLGEYASEVTRDEVVLKSGIRLQYGLCFWAGGTEARPLTRSLIDTLGPAQQEAQGSKRGQITVDRYLRALGSDGSIIALGDASTIEGIKIPTTGQVAAQEGAYVARLLNRGYNTSIEGPPMMTGYDDGLTGLTGLIGDFVRLRGRLEASPFHFINLGVLAYIGMGQAVADVRAGEKTPLLDAAGSAGFFLWRSTYVVKQVSLRNRINVAVDWLKVRVFGRDITKL